MFVWVIKSTDRGTNHRYIVGGAVSPKTFSALQALVWSKNMGGPGPPGPSPGSDTVVIVAE